MEAMVREAMEADEGIALRVQAISVAAERRRKASSLDIHRREWLGTHARLRAEISGLQSQVQGHLLALRECDSGTATGIFEFMARLDAGRSTLALGACSWRARCVWSQTERSLPL